METVFLVMTGSIMALIVGIAWILARRVDRRTLPGRVERIQVRRPDGTLEVYTITLP